MKKKTEKIAKEIIKKYGKTFKDLGDYDKGNKEKVFYNHNEWSGWRFYLKAIRHRDWDSILGKWGLRRK